MENYIIRVYSRSGELMDELAGLVEIVETSEKKAFVGFEELKRILNRTDKRDPNSRKC